MGPTGIRDVQGVANNSADVTQPGFWFGAADTLFPRLTFNRLTHPLKASDAVSRPFADSDRGTTVIIDDTTGSGATLRDSLNPRNISNLIIDSSDPVGYQSITQANGESDADYAARLKLSLQDDPTGRVSPVSGAVNPLPYSNWMSQFGQFFDHGLDFVNKGVDGKVSVKFLPSDGLYNPAMGATGITASRNNTVNITIGEGSTDTLLEKLGLDALQGAAPSWEVSSTITDATVAGGTVDGFTYKYFGTLVLNNTLIEIQARNETALVNQINLYTPTTGVVATIASFPTVPGVSGPGSFNLTLTPAPAESFNQTSPFIDLSQAYGSDASRTVFLREYLSESEWQAAPGNAGLEATITDLTTGRLANAGKTVNGVADSGIANWAQIKANAAKVGIILHDADITAIPLVAFDANGQLILDQNGEPQLVALNKVTGEIVYVKDTSVDSSLVLMTTKHAFLNDMGVRLPALTDTTIWSGRDLIDTLTPASQFGPAVNYKQVLEAHYIAGDGRLNENIGLTAVQEVFANEHNRVYELLKAEYGFTGEQPQGGWTWTDPLTNVTTKITGEELFQQAKLFNEMTYQHLVFDQFVRKLSPNIAGFAGVDPLIDARISSEFANAVYRFGHSMLPDVVGMRQYTDATKIATTSASSVVTVSLTNHGLVDGASVTLSGVDVAIGGIAAANLNGTFVVDVLDNNSFTFTATTAATGAATGLTTDKLQIEINKGLIEAFLNPQSYTPGLTVTQLTEGSTAQVGNRIDQKVTDALRDNLLGQPLDLATLNIVRGRDAGLPTLNEMRASLQGVAPVALQATLQAYTSWTGFRDGLKGTLADQTATVKNFMMAYASDDILTKFGTTKTLAQWYALRESAVEADQTEYMTGLKAATDAAYANATWMGINGNLDFNRIDAWIGGLAEREVVGGMLGSTFDAVFAMQMMALQNGDHFYYLGRVPATEFFVENMEGIQLADIVMRSSGATNVYADIFSVADKYLNAGDTAGLASAATFEDLQAITTSERVFGTDGQYVTAAIGTAGYVGNTLFGNSGNYVDARGVLNPNGVGNASEMIMGTDLGDRVESLGGNDNVRAGLGNDTVLGGSGVDFLYGDGGNDSLDGGTEDDFMYGGVGNDTMLGNIGIDVLFGQDGNDQLLGGADADIINGGEGNDTLYGGDNIDVGGILDPEPAISLALLDDNMNGGSGDDVMYGGGGWDAMAGASGHDILIPGSGGVVQGGIEDLDGGQGDDIYIVENDLWFVDQHIADGGLTQLELINKGAGFRQGNGIGVDEVRFTQTVAGDIIIGGTNALGVAQLFSGVERVVIGTGIGTNAVRAGGADINIDASLAAPGLNIGLEILANGGVNTIVGTAFSDTIDGGADADIMEGGLGDEVYVVDNVGDQVVELTGGGNDTVNSSVTYVLGAELENLTLTAGNTTGTGNSLGNVITGSGGNNLLSGLDGADSISGGAGADTIIGGAGVDTMAGGAGADVFRFGSVADIGNNALLRETITDFLSGSDTFDFTQIDADTATIGHQGFTYIGTNAFTAAGQIRYQNGVLEGNVTGASGAEFSMALNGTSSATLTQNDFVALPTVSVARTSNATVAEGNTGSSQHTFSVTLSRASLVPTTVAWAIATSGTLTASDFTGNITSGTVTIAAGQRTGTITVDVAGDTTVETNEAFTVTLSSPSGATLGTSTATATIGNDDVAPPPPPPPPTPTIQTITGTNANGTHSGTAGADIISGLGGNDVLNGLAGNDTIDGGTGTDNISGGDGDDSMVGGTGNDVIAGGNGNDILIGNAGADRLTGNAGADVFRFLVRADSTTQNQGRDTITDFQTGVDKIDLSALDANETAVGDQAFTFIGGANFTALGQLRFANGILSANTTGGTGADFSIVVQGSAVIGTDVIL